MKPIRQGGIAVWHTGRDGADAQSAYQYLHLVQASYDVGRSFVLRDLHSDPDAGRRLSFGYISEMPAILCIDTDGDTCGK